MRYVLLVALVAVAALYFTVGLRLGVLNLSGAYLLNAQGTNRYPYRTFDNDQQVTLIGACDVKQGKVVLRFLDPSGTQIAGQECNMPGRFGLNLGAGGASGVYTLEVEYQKFTGHLSLDEQRSGAH